MTESQADQDGKILPRFQSPALPRLVYGCGEVERVGELVLESQGRRILLVTDPGVVAAGHAERVEKSLKKAGIDYAIYDRVRENPTTEDVNECVAAACRERIDFLIGLGGGSSMDTAKGCNFLFTNGGEMKDYWGTGKATLPMLPMIAIPTTAGTGSECQSYALIADEKTHRKMACGDTKAAAKVALLDPELTLSQPTKVKACTGVDALAHALESAVTLRQTPMSRIWSREAFRLIARSLSRVLSDGADMSARGEMMLGAAYSGLAIENSMLGAAHSAANPLTADYGIVHGQAVGLMLPRVIAFNAECPEAREIYLELVSIGKLSADESDPELSIRELVAYVDRVLEQAELAVDLATLGVEESRIPELSQQAAEQWTAQFNPRTVLAEDFEGLYRYALRPRNSTVPSGTKAESLGK